MKGWEKYVLASDNRIMVGDVLVSPAIRDCYAQYHGLDGPFLQMHGDAYRPGGGAYPRFATKDEERTFSHGIHLREKGLEECVAANKPAPNKPDKAGGE